jgi:hypothetical protein
VACGHCEIQVGRQESQLVPDAQLREQRVNQAHLNARTQAPDYATLQRR